MDWPDETVQKLKRYIWDTFDDVPDFSQHNAEAVARHALDAISDDVVLKSELREERELKPQHRRGFGSHYTGRRRLVTEWKRAPDAD